MKKSQLTTITLKIQEVSRLMSKSVCDLQDLHEEFFDSNKGTEEIQTHLRKITKQIQINRNKLTETIVPIQKLETL